MHGSKLLTIANSEIGSFGAKFFACTFNSLLNPEHNEVLERSVRHRGES